MIIRITFSLCLQEANFEVRTDAKNTFYMNFLLNSVSLLYCGCFFLFHKHTMVCFALPEKMNHSVWVFIYGCIVMVPLCESK